MQAMPAVKRVFPELDETAILAALQSYFSCQPQAKLFPPPLNMDMLQSEFIFRCCCDCKKCLDNRLHVTTSSSQFVSESVNCLPHTLLEMKKQTVYCNTALQPWKNGDEQGSLGSWSPFVVSQWILVLLVQEGEGDASLADGQGARKKSDLDEWILENVRDHDLRWQRNSQLGNSCRPFSYAHAEVVAELGAEHFLPH